MSGVNQKQEVLYRLGMVHPLVLGEPERLGGDTSAWLSHVPFAFWLTLVLRPHVFVELGTHTGVSYSAFCQAVRDLDLPTRAFAVDTWQGDQHAGLYSDNVFRELNLYNEDKYAGFSQLMRCTFDEAVQHFADHTVDLLHIDGLHTYEAVRHDFKSWLPKLKPNAIVLFHDTQVRDRGFGVWRLFEELRRTYPAFEFHHGHGLGIICVGDKVPAGLEGLLLAPGRALDPAVDAAIQSYFSTLGENWVKRGAREAELQRQLNAVEVRLDDSQRDMLSLKDSVRRAAAEATQSVTSGEPELAQRSSRLQAESVARLSGELATQRRRNVEEVAELNREIESLKDQLDSELIRRERLAALAATHIACARRGLKGAIGAVVRRYGSGPLIDQCAALTRSGLFNRRYYIYNYKNQMLPNVEPVVDYVLSGAYEGRNPNPLFDSSYYLRTNPDVHSSGVNPLLHYILDGEAQGRRPSQVFDPIEYRAAHPELASDTLALADYIQRAHPSLPIKGGSVFTRFWRRWVASTVHREAGSRTVLSKGGNRSIEAKYLSKISFEPEPGPVPVPAVPADRCGKYVWSLDASYTYLPPAPPAQLDARIAALPYRPLFSIVVPLYNTPLDLLAKLVASVQAQWYPDWELILVDDASPKMEVRAAVSALDDARIIKLFQGQNSGIAGATNAGIAAANGDYIVFLDHDDELTVDCLYELARCATRNDADFIYSDEDKIASDGRFVEPFFKPDWSPDTLMSLMYTCHVSCIRKSLLVKVGLLRPEYDGSQDWDLVLRVTEQTTKIFHIPKVLYHWRIIPRSTSGTFDAKPAALVAAKHLRLDALRRRNAQGVIEDLGPGSAYSRVRYFVSGSPLISIVIPSKNNPSVLRKCLDSIFSITAYENYEVVIVDNGSTNEAALSYLSTLSANPKVKVLVQDRPFNFSELCNAGAREAGGEILLFLNDDTEVLNGDWLERMAGYAQQTHVGAVGAKLLYPNSLRVQHAGVVNIAPGPSHAFLGAAREEPGYFARSLLEYNWIAVTGACLMVERVKFDAVGRFDESFPVAYNDVDLCYRLLEAGYFNVLVPAVELLHYESLSRGIDHLTEEKRRRLHLDKQRLDLAHPDFYLHDPFYNENLNPSEVGFKLQA
ncbi:MAG: glycosyltransferase [Pseudomonadota bacterium]